MKFKTVDNKFYGFSTKNEFMALVVKISGKQQMSEAVPVSSNIRHVVLLIANSEHKIYNVRLHW